MVPDKGILICLGELFDPAALAQNERTLLHDNLRGAFCVDPESSGSIAKGHDGAHRLASWVEGEHFGEGRVGITTTNFPVVLAQVKHKPK